MTNKWVPSFKLFMMSSIHWERHWVGRVPLIKTFILGSRPEDMDKTPAIYKIAVTAILLYWESSFE